MIKEIFNFLDENEIDYRLESNFCCSYIFYFLDGSIYPRRYFDSALDKDIGEKIECQSVDNLIEKAISTTLRKDWEHRIESRDIETLFKDVKDYLTSNYNYE